MTFLFGEQKKIGLKGETWLREYYHTLPLVKMDSHSPVGDFTRPDGKILEIKTDTYPLARTPNFFMEYHSNTTKKTMGGPWRAHAMGADLFLYLFIHDEVYFEFTNLRHLVSILDEYIKDEHLKIQNILNIGYRTSGYKIPREILSSLYKEYSR